MPRQEVDGELLKDGSVPATKLVSGLLVQPGPDTVAAEQIDGGDAVAIRAKIGVDRAQAIGSDLTASATLNLSAATGDYVTVNGAATVTAIVLGAGKEAVVRFANVCTLTHSATLVMPGAQNYTTTAGDVVRFRGLVSGVICVGMVRVGGPSRMNRYYEASPQIITSGSAISNTHGLGVEPTLVQGFLVNVTGEAGYTTGQIVQCAFGYQGSNRGASATISSTAVVVRFGSDANAFAIPHATTGATTALTNANWNFFLRAWAP